MEKQLYTCEHCSRCTFNRPYAINDMGVVRWFCSERHADRYIEAKYQMSLPLNFDSVPCSNYGTNKGGSYDD